MLCNVVSLSGTIAVLVGGCFCGQPDGCTADTGALLVCLCTVSLRFGFTMLASNMSDRASKDVKRTLRSKIYEKLTRLGAGYSETVATSGGHAGQRGRGADRYLLQNTCPNCSTVCWPR